MTPEHRQLAHAFSLSSPLSHSWCVGGHSFTGGDTPAVEDTMKEAIAMTLTLLALGCTQEAVGPDRDAIGTSDVPPPIAATDGSPGGDCNEIVCHEYGGGIEECVCVDDGSQLVLDLGVGPEPDPDPYAD